MASIRAFAILNNQTNGNHANGNRIKNVLKSGEARPTAPFALKDLTNNNKTGNVRRHDGLEKAGNKLGQPLKITPKISKESKKTAPPKTPLTTVYDIFSPQNAEYGWANATCLREDLLEQMIDFDISCEIKRKPLPPVEPSDPFDLPELDTAWDDCLRTTKEHHFNPVKLMDLPANDFPLVDIQDLEFLF